MSGNVSSDERALLDVACEAAEAAAAELRNRFGHRQAGVRTKSSPTDPVSDADVAAETAIRSVLSRRAPGDAILGEEGGATGDAGQGTGLTWIVDPLDGTTNFLFSLPVFAVSVACEDSAGAVVGVVLDPLRGETFTATRSGAAMVDGAPLQPATRSELSTALVATGFGYDAGVRARQAEVVSRLLPRVRDVRRLGSAALDLAWCASGRYDAYFERGLQRWDRAAGALIASRAGLRLHELEARGDVPAGLAVAPAGLMDALLELLA